MTMYQVWLNGLAQFIEVQADNVNTSSGGDEGAVWWNFTINEGAVTVAAFPFAGVAYIISPPPASPIS